MDIQFFGANCIAVNYKGTRIVIDDTLAGLGGKDVLHTDDIALFTGAHSIPKVNTKLLVDQPGEYEVADVSIVGIAAQAHTDEAGTHAATMYKITAAELRVLFTGHVYSDISDAQLELIGQVDVLILPVGGMGYTLDAVGAQKLIKEFEPKLIIPTHYADKSLAYPVPQQELAQALKELGMEPKETVARLKLKPGDLTDIAQLAILEKS